MINCLVAQSGGPTAVINSSFIGVLDQALESKCYDNVYAGINGIEGILQNKLINLSKIPYNQLQGLKYTPSSALGSCRYKMKDYQKDTSEYKKLFSILKEHNIKAFFYIGGNDSMDTVRTLSEYTKLNNIDIQVMGIPKTIDNDLMETDHTPGFGSASKFIASTILETYLDSSVYMNNGIFIVETMGRDTGWLTASAALAKINGEPVVDFIYLPEVTFSKEKFLEEVNEKFKEQNQVYIVASEGIKDEKGSFLGENTSSKTHDKFGHAQLGGVCNTLKSMIIERGITSRVKTLELGVTQRCAMHYASLTDIEEAYNAGKEAVKYACEGITGFMVGIRRLQNNPYKSDTILVEPSKVANHIKYFPKSWITSEGNWVTEDAVNYIAPLIQGTPAIPMENGLPKYTILKR
ncbi:6-phosphofructokinase [Clostridium sp. SYSU_GA19001]|uniref:6-phosphofructokinase n=1 Tax=Clostridium caldaquaticum TaxID=2940653 RepID=UPI00207776F7|nr:6-phosphofructokinase [Clostridium caldaquaticum]MCM8711318.1 6-phosphofructokinase [Clostridium caldaquaticum]